MAMRRGTRFPAVIVRNDQSGIVAPGPAGPHGPGDEVGVLT
jgi:hypothetical protein